MSASPITPAIRVHRRQTVPQTILLWTVTILLAASAMLYQRMTGPTYPMRGKIDIDGQEYKYRLIRTHETTEAAAVTIPDIGPDVTATLFHKRYRTDDEYTTVPMTKEEGKNFEDKLVARLSQEPAAGKVEYYIEVQHDDQTLRIPQEEENVVLRYKDPVPNWILIPHVTMMILAIICGMRAGLAALFAPVRMRLYAWLAFGFMTIGGMVLGPIVQKYAFGEYWTGFPFGSDWTDNKMAVMWVSWFLACSVIGFSYRKIEGIGRVMVLAASLAMSVAYLIPHSMGGSELDYQKLDEVSDPRDAIRTGKQ